jgi:hypothetical protein
VLLAATAVAALAVGAAPLAPALGETQLGWSEHATVKGNDVLEFEVKSLTIDKAGWSAHVSFRNMSDQTVGVGNIFGLSFYKGAELTPTTRVDAFGHASRFTPAKPTSLAPGESWSGVIEGTGHPKPALSGTVHARVLFGPFYGVPGFPNKPFFWITDHSRTVDLTKQKGPIGLVI